MRKLETVVALGLLIVSCLPALADDNAKGANTDAPAAADQSDNSAGGKQSGGARKRRDHHGHQGQGGRVHIPAPKEVLGLADLNDKQRTQIKAIYDGKKDQFADLRKQKLALEEDSWKQVQAILTPDQVGALSAKKAVNAAPEDDNEGDAAPAKGRATK